MYSKAMSNERTVIVFANRKGGVGKTKSCLHVAEVLRQRGLPVTGIDMDPERGWIKYSTAGLLEYPVIEANDQTVRSVVQGLSGFIVIDTPPNDAQSMTKAALLADEVFVPVAATGDDIGRLDSTLADIEDIEQARSKLLLTVFFTRWDGRKIISREARETMHKRGIAVADQAIPHSTEFEKFAAPTRLTEYTALLEEVKVIDA